MPVPHPIPYQGSKRHLASAILSCLPRKATRLVEPFAGSAAISLAAAHCDRAESFLLNDVNEPLMMLWNAIVQRPDDLVTRYKELWHEQQGHEREYYDHVRDAFNNTHEPHLLLYLLARCVKASVRYNALGEFNQSPDNRRKGAHPDTMATHVLGASRLLRGRTRISSTDYRNVLKTVTDGDIVYMDPPYQGVSHLKDPRYIGPVTYDDFCEALAQLNQKRIPYAVSYDGHNGLRSYGKLLPESLNLTRVEVDAGRSSQATLLGRTHRTYESLYLSPALQQRVTNLPRLLSRGAQQPLPLQLPA